MLRVCHGVAMSGMGRGMLAIALITCLACARTEQNTPDFLQVVLYKRACAHGWLPGGVIGTISDQLTGGTVQPQNQTCKARRIKFLYCPRELEDSQNTSIFFSARKFDYPRLD